MEFIKNVEELLKVVKDLKDQLVRVTIEQEEKTKYLINKTHNTYEMGIAKFKSLSEV